MKYESHRLKQMLAAEYVVGTLVGAARRRFQRMLEQDRWLRGEVRYWQDRFDNLGIFEPVPPRPMVWAEIERRLREQEDKVVPLVSQRRQLGLNFWRVWSGVATAAALVLALFILQQTPPPVPQELPRRIVEVRVPAQVYVAALRLPKEEAQWTVSLLPDARAVRVSVNGPAQLSDKEDYELWWLGDEGGVTSLGLLPRSGSWQVSLPPDLRLKHTGKVAVSLEPAGGSPAVDGPSGPVLLAAPVVPSV